ncbi:hypothetical protein ACLI4Z_00515 [Natrialbaceae archaeon A-arb3/5]
MDLTQIGLGVGLLVVSGLAFVGPSTLGSDAIFLLTAAAMVVGAVAVFASVARDAQLS